MKKYRPLITLAFTMLVAACARNVPFPSFCPCSMVHGAGSEMDVAANVGDREFYAFDSATLSPDGDTTLGRQAVWLAKYPAKNVLIAGNADERGTETYNLALGQRRADAARSVLLAQGVAPSRIKTISYGKDCPVAAGNNEAAYQQNRNAITSVQGFNPQNCR